jgi:hypothetical protein
MGCDFHWEATEIDVYRQRKTGWYIESLFDAGENGQSSIFNSSVKLETFNGFYTGYFLDTYKQKNTVELKSMHMIGATIYYDMDICKGYAERQYSFVFNNSETFPPRLITFEKINDISMHEYDWVRDQFSDIKTDDPNLILGLYRKGSYDRLLANEGWLAELLYSIKKQFLPNLSASDDYGYIESLTKKNPAVSSNFSESICQPGLAKKWGLDKPKLY